jgi:uncharacterized protein (DUF983 family)
MSANTDGMPCPRCGSEQTRAKLRLVVTRRTKCSNCGVKLRIRGHDLVIAVVRAGLSMLPVTLFLALVTSAWWLLILPAVWWVALLYLLLASRHR